MRIAIVGAGAIGGVVAWRLAHAGLDPVIVARPETAARLAEDGLTLDRPDGSRDTQRPRVTADGAALGPQDLVLAGFKAHDWPAALPMVTPLLGPDTTLVPMLNGIPWWYFQGAGGPHEGRPVAAVDPGGRLLAAIPAPAVLGCVVYMGASRDGPSVLRWNGRNRLVLGEPAGGRSGRLERVVALLQAAGLGAEASDDIRGEVWMKLLGNATYNPLSVLAEADMGTIAEDPGLRRTLRAIMEELVAVAAALGVSRRFDVEERLKLTPTMAGFRTSMLQDYDAGRPLELGALVDAPVELGALLGMGAPVLDAVGTLARQRWRLRHGAA